MNRQHLSIILLVWAAPALAQPKRPAIEGSSAKQVMARVGAKPGAPWFLDVLRQNKRQDSPALLDELADSLVTRATERGQVRQGSAAYVAAFDATNALILAGMNAPLGGQPYRGALDRLILIHRRAPTSAVRVCALNGMLSVASPRSRAVAYLRSVAESTDSTALEAVRSLVTDADGGSYTGLQPTPAQQHESAAALKALASRGRVTDRWAARALDAWMTATQSAKPD
jgi:hypothetical protein